MIQVIKHDERARSWSNSTARAARPVAVARRGPAWARAYLLVFRAVIVSLCILGALVGWLTGIPWLFAASVCIGLGELLECTYYLVVLDWGARTGRIVV